MKSLLLVLLLTSSAAVYAGGLRLVTQDAFAAGRAEAFAATADNASAIYYNPAGLGFLDDAELRMSAYNLYFEPTFQNPYSNERFEIEENFAAVPSLFYSQPIGESGVTIGLGLYSPYGAAAEWPDDTGFWSVAHSATLEYIRFSPVVAWKISEEFSVGAGLLIDYAELSMQQGLSRTPGPLKNNFKFKGDGMALGYNLGALWRPNPNWSFGLNFRSKTKIKFKGKTEVLRQPIIPQQSLPAETKLDFPLTAVFGISWRPNEKWNIEYNADYTAWRSFDQTVIRQNGSLPPTLSKDIDVNFDWKGSWIHSIGVTREFGSEWHASLGYAFSQNSVNDTYYSPLVADLDRHFLTFGIGRKGEHWDFDIAYQHGFADEREVEGSLPGSTPSRNFGQNGDGTYDFTSHAVAISIGYRF